MISYANSRKSFEILCNPPEIQLKSYEIPGERSTSGERLARLEAQRARASQLVGRAGERASRELGPAALGLRASLATL